MDMFMDKLTQKLTAQEIIRANTAADTAELNRLKNQVAEYNECLERLQKLVSEGEDKLSRDGGEPGQLQGQVAELLGNMDKAIVDQLCNMDKAMADQLDGVEQKVTERLSGMEKAVTGRLDGAEIKVAGRLDGVEKVVTGRLDGVEKTVADRLKSVEQGVAQQFESMTQTLDGKLANFESQGDVKFDDKLTERLDAIDENTHREGVKIYRNVQAVVLEESGKQSETAKEIGASVDRVRSKLNLIFGISLAALFFSLAGVAVQILSILNIIN